MKHARRSSFLPDGDSVYEGVLQDPLYLHTIEVTSDDIDALGHASNIAYVRWVQEVAVAHSEAVGFGYEAYRTLGGIFVIRRHEVDYLRPAVRGERLEVRTWVCSAQAAKCLRATEVRGVEDGILRAKASTTWGFVDVTTGRPTRIPDAIRVAFLQPARGQDKGTFRSPTTELVALEERTDGK